MSAAKTNDSIADFFSRMDAEVIVDNRRRALEEKELGVREKKVEVDAVKYEQQFSDLKLIDSERLAVETLNTDRLPDSYLEESKKDLELYLEGARFRKRCMLPCFDPYVPLYAKNLLLFGATSGNGKSATAAEIAAACLRQIDQSTRKPCRVLVITNEETRSDFLMRVCFLANGWKYSRPDLVESYQREALIEFQAEMERSNQLVVIDNAYPGITMPTTSVEGLQAILESVHRNNDDYGVIIIDYYQKISASKGRRSESVVDTLARVSNILDAYRKLLKCPIVVMAQLHPKSADRQEFQSRLKERKTIFEAATFVAEIVPDRETFATEFIIHKNRFIQGSVGHTVVVGFDPDRGCYVPMTNEFSTQAQNWAIDRMKRDPQNDD